MQQELRGLVGKYGFRAVHEGLLKEMREQFEYLLSIFPPAKNDIVVPVMSEMIPEPITTPKHAPLDMIVGIQDIPNINDLLLPAPKIQVTLIDSPKENEEEPIQTPKHEENIKEIEITGKASTQINNKDFDKKQHRLDVAAKRKELEAKGIKPESLLTKENLEAWLEKGLSYNRIAREITGVHENDISAIAKTFGLKSKISGIQYQFHKKRTTKE